MMYLNPSARLTSEEDNLTGRAKGKGEGKACATVASEEISFEPTMLSEDVGSRSRLQCMYVGVAALAAL